MPVTTQCVLIVPLQLVRIAHVKMYVVRVRHMCQGIMVVGKCSLGITLHHFHVTYLQVNFDPTGSIRAASSQRTDCPRQLTCFK